MFPRTSAGTLADEATMLAHIASEATLAGWSVAAAGGITWFKSLGECGHLNIVGGLEIVSTRFRGYTAADRDDLGLIGPPFLGYTNEDPLGVSPATKVPAPTTATASQTMRPRGASSYAYRMRVDGDSIAILLGYTSTAVRPAQAFIYIGTEQSVGTELTDQAKARVAQVLPGVLAPPGTSVLVVLDDDITPALKDVAIFPVDPAPQRLVFQTVTGPAMVPYAADFALTERAPAIIPGSLATVGGVTQFEMLFAPPGPLTSKLFQAGLPPPFARYDIVNHGDPARAVGDLVRVHTQRNICICGGADNGSSRFGGSNEDAIAAFDTFGGQRGGALPLNIRFTDRISTTESTSDPDPITFRYDWYSMYVLPLDTEGTIIAQADEGRKVDGALRGAVMAASTPTGGPVDFAVFQINDDINQQYMALELIGGANGMDPPSGFGSNDLRFAVGEGF